MIKNSKFYGLGLKKYSDSTWTRPDGRVYYDWGVYLIYIDTNCNLNKIYLAHYITEDNNNGAIEIIDNDHILVFHTKSDTYMYAMTGYLYHINLTSKEISQETLFEQANWGWFPIFECISSPCNVEDIHHFSFAGYYEMLNTSSLGQIEPNIMMAQYYKAQKEHSQSVMNEGDIDYDKLFSLLDCSEENSDNLCSEQIINEYYTKGFEEGKKFCRTSPKECGIDKLKNDEADLGFQEGYNQGYNDCLAESIINDLFSSEEFINELSFSGNCEASFNMFTNTLHVPCLDMGKSYWLDLELINAEPVQLELKGFGEN